MKQILLIVFQFFVIQAYNQDIIVSFNGDIPETEIPVTLDSVKIVNLSQDANITIIGNVSFNLTIGEIVSAPLIDEHSVFQVYPNPFKESTIVDFNVKNQQNVSIMISNINGKRIATWNRTVIAGRHSCQFFPESSGIHIVTIRTDNKSISEKIISISPGKNATSEIVYLHQKQTKKFKETIVSKSIKDFRFTIGDNLKYTGYYNDYLTEIIDNPSVSTSYTFTFIEDSSYCWEIENWDGLLTDSQMIIPDDPTFPVVDSVITNWLFNNENHIDIRSLTNMNCLQ